MGEIQVKTLEGSYPVYIGHSLYRTKLREVLGDREFGKAAVVSHPSLLDEHGGPIVEALAAILGDRGRVAVFTFPEGEESKSLATVERGYAFLLGREFNREDVILAFGGGVVGDLAGFLASTYMRGLQYLQLPTTLMSMVDSSIGGKVGVDLPEAKNAVGTFYQPVAVIGDLEVLRTLPEREFLSGMAEVAKYGFLYDSEVLEKVMAWAEQGGGEIGEMETLVLRCAEIKAGVVGRDEKDLGGERALLNYGHTFGHALESSTAYRVFRHGEAVAVGMIMAARASELAGIAQGGLLQLHMRALRPMIENLPPAGRVDTMKVCEDMGRDKKRGRRMRFVLLEGPQKPVLVDNLPEGVVVRAVEETIDDLGGGKGE
jgi:3-dehydroquinate synthase